MSDGSYRKGVHPYRHRIVLESDSGVQEIVIDTNGPITNIGGDISAVLTCISEKFCYVCGEWKYIDRFQAESRNADNLYHVCRRCKHVRDRERASPEARKRRNVRRNVMARESRKLRMARNPKYRIQKNWSKKVSKMLKRCGSGKRGRSWVDMLGYTGQDLISHLESQFEHGMTWDNYGFGDDKWHIDHIIPIRAFNFSSPNDEDFVRCNALENLRPLWQKENLAKGGELAAPFQPSLVDV